VVVPNAVGVDIGCGMFAVKTSLYDYDLTPDKLSAIMAGIRNTVPMGVGQHQEAPQEWERFDNPPSLPVIENQLVAARRDLDLNLEQAKMTALGVVGGPRTTRELDEAPGAYKDIDAVMANQTDLVKVVTKLRPLASMKG
jgi:RNA-splicing ligase RtcB